MQITRETDYAIRCVQYLCKNPGEIKMVDEISEEMEIPKSFLAKILQKLTKAKVVKSFRGVKGGFMLLKKPKDINLWDVIKITEGPIAINICAVNKKACSLSKTCSVHPIWIDIREELEDRLKSIDFESLSKNGKRS
jgi:Rrf2 family protein